MKFAKLEEAGRAMSPDQVMETLRALASDPRFGAVVRIIQEQKELAADNSCQLKFAEHHGCLAHASGVRYAMLELEGRIRQACEPVKKRHEKPPE